jgi:hypothetical protein
LATFEITYDTADHLCNCLTVINKYNVKANSIPTSVFEEINKGEKEPRKCKKTREAMQFPNTSIYIEVNYQLIMHNLIQYQILIS